MHGKVAFARRRIRERILERMNARWGACPQDRADEAAELDAAMPAGEFGEVPGGPPVGDVADDGVSAGKLPAGAGEVALAAAADGPLADSAVAAPKAKGKGKGRPAAKGKGQAPVAKRALPPLPVCPADVCPACWNQHHGRQAMGRHDRGQTGLRCLLPLEGKRRRTAAEAGLEDVFPAPDGADDLPAAEGAGDGADWGVEIDFDVVGDAGCAEDAGDDR
jgi:hypothetical protein